MMDSVSSEYGWSDEYIRSMRYARFREIHEIIQNRRKEEAIIRHSYAQLFYNLLALLPTWKGSPPWLPDLFASEEHVSAEATEQFRTDLWWQAANN